MHRRLYMRDVYKSLGEDRCDDGGHPGESAHLPSQCDNSSPSNDRRSVESVNTLSNRCDTHNSMGIQQHPLIKGGKKHE